MSLDALKWASANLNGLTKSAGFVLVRLADHHNGKTGKCFPSIDMLMTNTGLSRSSVLRGLAELRQAELIEIAQRGNQHTGSNRYILNLEVQVSPPQDAGVVSESAGVIAASSRYQPGHPNRELTRNRTRKGIAGRGSTPDAPAHGAVAGCPPNQECEHSLTAVFEDDATSSDGQSNDFVGDGEWQGSTQSGCHPNLEASQQNAGGHSWFESSEYLDAVAAYYATHSLWFAKLSARTHPEYLVEDDQGDLGREEAEEWPAYDPVEEFIEDDEDAGTTMTVAEVAVRIDALVGEHGAKTRYWPKNALQERARLHALLDAIDEALEFASGEDLDDDLPWDNPNPKVQQRRRPEPEAKPAISEAGGDIRSAVTALRAQYGSGDVAGWPEGARRDYVELMTRNCEPADTTGVWDHKPMGK